MFRCFIVIVAASILFVGSPSVFHAQPSAQPIPLSVDAFPAELKDAAAQIGPVYAKWPDDASVLYQVAALHARAGHTQLALDALTRMADLHAGLQPRPRDGFQGLVENADYRALADRIRRENPPVLHARRAFDIADPSLVPEGIAWSGVTKKLYLGSLARKIVAATRDGRVEELVAPGTGGLGVVLGIRVDDARGDLWAVSGFIGTPPPDFVAGIFRFRLADGRLIRAYAIPGSDKDLLNDLAVGRDGAVYATATNTGALVRLSPETGQVEEFLPKGTLPDPNGIAITADGRHAFVAGWHGIVRVDLQTRDSLLLSKPSNVADGCIDGLYLENPRALVGVQNCVHETGRVVRLQLSPDTARVASLDVLESYNPVFDGITTAAVADSTLFFVANVQFRKMGRDGKPLVPLDPFKVLALELR